MNATSTFFLKAVIWLLGAVVFALCVVVLPAGIMSDQTGLYRPILIGMYVPAIPFFFALHQTLKLLGAIDRNNAFSALSVNALQNIRRCAIAISVFYAASLPYIFYVGDRDDAPGVIVIGFVIVFASVVVAVFSAVLQKLVRNALEIQSENDLTV